MSTNSLSIVVSTMNRDSMLDETLESLAAQTVKVSQVIVIDDGGPGTAKKIVDKYGSSFQYFWKPNGGVQSARNFGFTKATGNWIAFLDDDDIWELNRNQIVESIINKEAVDLIVGDFSIFNEKGTTSESFFSDHAKFRPDFWQRLIRTGNDLYSVVHCISPIDLFPEYPFWGAMTIIKRAKLLEIGGWDETLRGIPSEDLDFVFRAVSRSRIGLIWQPTMRYRSHAGNVSQDSTKKLLGRAEIAERLIKKERLTGGEVDSLKTFIQKAKEEAHWTYFHNRDFQMVLKVSCNMDWSNMSISSKVKTAVAYIAHKLKKIP